MIMENIVIMEKKMEMLFRVQGLYRDGGKEHGNCYLFSVDGKMDTAS